MTPERFDALALAYGAEIERWPFAERGQARKLAAARDGDSIALAEAARLDAILEASQAPSPSHGLREAIITGSPRPRPGTAPLRWLLPAFAAAGLGGACAAAGVAAGILITPAALIRQADAPGTSLADGAALLLGGGADSGDG